MGELELDYSAFLEPEPVGIGSGTTTAGLGGPGAAPSSSGKKGKAAKAEKPRLNPLARIHYNAPVTLTFTFLSLAVLGLAELTGGASNWWFSISRMPMSDPALYLRLFTHVLGHANWAHYFGNFMMILLLGPILEEKYGSGRLALMIAVTALVTGVVHVLFSPFGLLGASGIVFMMILLISFANIQAGRIPLTLILILVLYIGQEVVTWVTTDTNVAHAAHIVGGLCGAAFGFLHSPASPEGGVKSGKRGKRGRKGRRAAQHELETLGLDT